MPIAALFNVPGNEVELQRWSFSHAVHHFDIINAIYVDAKIALPEFVLDPFDPNNPSSMENWIYLHQEMHRNQNAILNIAGFDLTDINWQDESSRASFIQLNANEHLQASNILEIG